VTGEVYIDTSFKSNILAVVWTVIVLCAMVGGLVVTLVMNALLSNFSTSDIINKAICLPLFFTVSILMIVMKGTVNKPKIEQFLNKISKIDKDILICQKVQEYSRIKFKNHNCYSEIIVLALVFVPFLMYDIWSFIGYIVFVCKTVTRLCEVLQFVFMTQHCQFIKFIRIRFNILRYAVSTVLDERCEESETGTSVAIHEAFKHKFATGMTKISPEFISDKKLSAYKVKQSSEANNMNLFSCHAEKFVHLRRVYGRLCDTVGLVNSMHGFLVMFLIVQIFTELITSVNHIMHYLKTNSSLHFPDPTPLIVYIISRIVLSLGILVATIVSCHVTVLESKEIGNEVQKLLLKYPLRSDTTQQLQLFSHQISYSDIKFTAFWLFDLDISFLCTIFASSITYIILLAQLN
jgi:hypothetical protein